MAQTIKLDGIRIPEGTLPLTHAQLLEFDWDGVTLAGGRVVIATIRQTLDGFHHCRVMSASVSETKRPVATWGVPTMLDALMESHGAVAGDMKWQRADESRKNEVVAHDRVSGEIVYFLRAGEFVKIGKSTGTPDSRVNQLRTGCPFPIEVMATIPGGLDLERSLHRRFAHCRAHGEWFHATPGLLAYVAEMRGTA